MLDEAVSARCVSVQAQIVNLLEDLQDLQDLQSELELACISISHELTVVRFMADKAVVMKEGEAVEQASIAQFLGAPQQAYTRRLLGAIQRGDRVAA